MTAKQEPEWAVHPGLLLHDALLERRMKQADLARQSGLTQKHISQIVRGKSGVGTDAAWAIERAIGLSARVLLRMQADWDVVHHKRRAR